MIVAILLVFGFLFVFKEFLKIIPEVVILIYNKTQLKRIEYKRSKVDKLIKEIEELDPLGAK